MTAIAPVRLDAVTDYRVDAKMRLLRHPEPGFITGYGSFGLVARANGSRKGYGAGYCAAVGLLSCTSNHQPAVHVAVLWANDDPHNPSTLGHARPFHGKRQWHHYRLRVRGNQITFWLDGIRITSVRDNTFLLGGRAGLWSYNSQIEVRNFKVTAE